MKAEEYPNFAEDIEAVANGEPIEAIVITRYGPYDTWGEPPVSFAPEALGRVLTWAEARPHLDHTYDDGFGMQDCPTITAWTATRVLYVHEYDGSTSVESVQRHPPVGHSSHVVTTDKP